MGVKKNKPNNEQEKKELEIEQNENEQELEGQNEQDLESKQPEQETKSDNDSGYATSSTPPKKDKPFKYPVVSRWNCFKIIFYCLIVACTLFVPIVLDPQLIFGFQGAPLIGDGSIVKLQIAFAHGFSSLIGLEGVLAQPLSMIMEYCTLVFYGILALDIFFSLVLCALPFNGVRIVFRIFSIIFGICMFALAFLYLSSFIGFFGYVFMVSGDINGVLNNLGTQFLSSGLLFFLACTVFAFTLIKRQFKWFAKRPY